MIFVVYTVLAALLLLSLVYSRLWWGLKLGAIVVSLAFGFFTYTALDSYKGWPAPIAVPPNSAYVGCIVVEPSVVAHQPGAIYLWLVPLRTDKGVFYYTAHAQEPRSYVEPYSEDLQAACQSAQKMQQQGGGPVGLGRRKGGHGSPGPNSPGRYLAYRLPPVNPPQKG